MQTKVPMLALVALLGAAFALTLVGCAEEPDEVTGEMIDEVPEAAEEVYTDEPEDPGMEETSGVEVEEMVDPTPPHTEEGEAETGPTDGGVEVEEMTDDTPPHTEGN